jgi:hypothetical protein
MSGKLPSDRVHEQQDVPQTYERNRERFAEAEAALRESDDPVSGARPEAEPVQPLADERTDEDGDTGA